MRRFRTLNRWYAYVVGYFWKPCPMCGTPFGGHEHGEVSLRDGDHLWICCWKHEPEPVEIILELES